MTIGFIHNFGGDKLCPQQPRCRLSGLQSTESKSFVSTALFIGLRFQCSWQLHASFELVEQNLTLLSWCDFDTVFLVLQPVMNHTRICYLQSRADTGLRTGHRTWSLGCSLFCCNSTNAYRFSQLVSGVNCLTKNINLHKINLRITEEQKGKRISEISCNFVLQFTETTSNLGTKLFLSQNIAAITVFTFVQAQCLKRHNSGFGHHTTPRTNKWISHQRLILAHDPVLCPPWCVRFIACSKTEKNSFNHHHQHDITYCSVAREWRCFHRSVKGKNSLW